MVVSRPEPPGSLLHDGHGEERSPGRIEIVALAEPGDRLVVSAPCSEGYALAKELIGSLLRRVTRGCAGSQRARAHEGCREHAAIRAETPAQREPAPTHDPFWLGCRDPSG